YEEAADIVIGQFTRFSEKLGQFARTAFEKGWIDAEPADHKRHGAFCASFPNAKESRVMLSFTGNYNDVVTIAHELGHAYHNSLLHEQPGFSHKV
ncbi:M3 family metallopeptidase, partial [Planococcus sp. SIMBA_143]